MRARAREHGDALAETSRSSAGTGRRRTRLRRVRGRAGSREHFHSLDPQGIGLSGTLPFPRPAGDRALGNTSIPSTRRGSGSREYFHSLDPQGIGLSGMLPLPRPAGDRALGNTSIASTRRGSGSQECFHCLWHDFWRRTVAIGTFGRDSGGISAVGLFVLAQRLAAGWAGRVRRGASRRPRPVLAPARGEP